MNFGGEDESRNAKWILLAGLLQGLVFYLVVIFGSMIYWLIDITHAVDMFCNVWVMIWLYCFARWKIYYFKSKKEAYIAFLICVLGVILIPSNESLNIIFLP